MGLGDPWLTTEVRSNLVLFKLQSDTTDWSLLGKPFVLAATKNPVLEGSNSNTYVYVHM